MDQVYVGDRSSDGCHRIDQYIGYKVRFLSLSFLIKWKFWNLRENVKSYLKNCTLLFFERWKFFKMFRFCFQNFNKGIECFKSFSDKFKSFSNRVEFFTDGQTKWRQMDVNSITRLFRRFACSSANFYVCPRSASFGFSIGGEIEGVRFIILMISKI